MKIHKTAQGEVTAICDSELLGQVLSQGALKLDLLSHSGFYSGQKVSEAEAVQALSGSQNINLVGRKSLAAAKKAGVDTSQAILISGVPHLQAYRLI